MTPAKVCMKLRSLMNKTDDIRDRVIRHILAASDEELNAEEVRPETSLRDDLDLSSMQALTLVMDLEDEFEITVEDDELEGLKTVRDVLNLLDSKQVSS